MQILGVVFRVFLCECAMDGPDISECAHSRWRISGIPYANVLWTCRIFLVMRIGDARFYDFSMPYVSGCGSILTRPTEEMVDFMVFLCGWGACSRKFHGKKHSRWRISDFPYANALWTGRIFWGTRIGDGGFPAFPMRMCYGRAGYFGVCA